MPRDILRSKREKRAKEELEALEAERVELRASIDKKWDEVKRLTRLSDIQWEKSKLEGMWGRYREISRKIEKKRQLVFDFAEANAALDSKAISVED